MWAALRSDLSEFVSTVSTESTQALANVDDALTSLDRDTEDEDEEEHSDADNGHGDGDGDIRNSNSRGEEQTETQTLSSDNIIKDGETKTTGTSSKQATSVNNNNNNNNNDIMDGEMGYMSAGTLLASTEGSGYERTGIIATAEDEVARLRTLEETYTTDLPDTVSLIV
jgi:hypothetical protein